MLLVAQMEEYMHVGGYWEALWEATYSQEENTSNQWLYNVDKYTTEQT